MKNIAIITAGTLPVPAVEGGAVENLVENLITVNEKKTKVNFTVYSIFNEKAFKESKKYRYTVFKFIKIPLIIKFVDLMIYFLFSNVLKKKKSMSYRYIASRIYYIVLVGASLHVKDYFRVILENHATLFICIKIFGNYKKYKNKYIYHMHNILSGFYGCKKEIENARIVIGVSKFIIQQFKHQVKGYSKHTKFVVVKNCIDRENFIKKINIDRQEKFRKQFGINKGDKIVLFAGRMNKEKGIDVLIKAWNKLNDPDAILLIVGSYYFKSDMKNTSFNLELKNLLENTNNVKFTGYVDYKDMPNIYSLANFVVLPSMWEDPAPLTVVETLTLGLPLITTNSGGIPEYANEKSSIILNKHDKDFVRNLANAIDYYIENPVILSNVKKSTIKQTNDWTASHYYDEFNKAIRI